MCVNNSQGGYAGRTSKSKLTVLTKPKKKVKSPKASDKADEAGVEVVVSSALMREGAILELDGYKRSNPKYPAGG